MRLPQIATRRPASRSDRNWPGGTGARRAAVAVGASVLVLVLSGACGGSDDTASAATQPAPATSAPAGSASPTASGSGAAGATTVTVSETEFKIELSQDTFTPGTYTFVTDNDGQATHALEIEGPGLNEAETSNLGPGDSADLTVTLQAGTYTLYCPVGNHESQGMTLDITVG